MITEMTPYICVEDAHQAIGWYSAVFDAGVANGPIEMDDGRIGHVELYLGDARLFMSEEFADAGVAPPDGHRGAPVTMHLTTDHVDEFVERAAAHGARIDRGPSDTPYGRIAVVTDPFGHRGMLNTE